MIAVHHIVSIATGAMLAKVSAVLDDRMKALLAAVDEEMPALAGQ